MSDYPRRPATAAEQAAFGVNVQSPSPAAAAAAAAGPAPRGADFASLAQAAAEFVKLDKDPRPRPSRTLPEVLTDREVRLVQAGVRFFIAMLHYADEARAESYYDEGPENWDQWAD